MSIQNEVSEQKIKRDGARREFSVAENNIADLRVKKAYLEQQKSDLQKVITAATAAKDKAVWAYVQGKSSQDDADRARNTLKKSESALNDIDEFLVVTERAIREAEKEFLNLGENLRYAERAFFADLYEKENAAIREIVGDKARRAYAYGKIGGRNIQWEHFFYQDIFGKHAPDQTAIMEYAEDHNK